ncbi:MAG: hypothetical protein EOL87_16985 [Spartobacteria bacterium]|nr:hypothetical protein [Spartobacteria bacterium]
MSNYREELYAVYSKERDKLNGASLETGARYDRIVMTLSGGALVISLTFLEKVAQNPIPWTLWLIVPAWLLLLGSVILQLLTFAASQDAIRLQIDRLDNEYTFYFSFTDPAEAVERREPEGVNRFVTRATRFNTCSRWSLIIGMLLLFAFSACNLFK